MKQSTKTALSLLLAVLVAALLLAIDADKARYGMLVTVLHKGAILSIVAVAMNLLNGFTGLFSLGQAGFMAIGAYATAVLLIPVKTIDGVYYMNGLHPSIRAVKVLLEAAPEWVRVCYPFLALLLGGLLAALFAALIGIPVLRLKSDYLAIATLGFSEIIRALIASPQLDRVTNGSYGLKGIPGFGSLLTPFIVAAVCIAVILLLIRSSYGRAFQAIREDEIAAEAMGINLFRHKELSFVISSFFTGIAGGMLAMFMRSIDSRTFSITLTHDILLIVVIGGIGSVTGSVLGAFLVTASKEWWLRFFDQPLTIAGVSIPLFRNGFRMVVFSVLLMAVVLFYRRGLMGHSEFSWDAVARWFNRCKIRFGRRPERGGDAK